MEPRGSSVSPLRMRRRITTSAPEQDHSRSGASIGRAECREKKIGIEPKGSFFFLTFPLIGQRYSRKLRASRSFGEPQDRKVACHQLQRIKCVPVRLFAREASNWV